MIEVLKKLDHKIVLSDFNYALMTFMYILITNISTQNRRL